MREKKNSEFFFQDTFQSSNNTYKTPYCYLFSYLRYLFSKTVFLTNISVFLKSINFFFNSVKLKKKKYIILYRILGIFKI